MSSATKILRLADKLSIIADEMPSKELNILEDVANEVGRAWSGSWLGYHSRIYYSDLNPVPPGARFSKEWGLMKTFASNGTNGHWNEHEFEDLVMEIKRRAKIKDLKSFEERAEKIEEIFEESQAELLSLLTPVLADHESDKFLIDLVEKIRKEKNFSYATLVRSFCPTGQQMTRDTVAGNAGLETPPHISVLAEIRAIECPYICCANLSKFARRAASHIENFTKREASSQRVGTNIFIGHGRSKVWRDLKDFIQDRLHLPYDEFNRVPVAGVTNIARLSQMLDSAAIGLIVLTAEDEQTDGKMHARMNVIHEAGLFQGRLGFEKAILLLEEGCEEFSNVQGLGQIRFPKGNIASKFEDIRQVLEREGLLE